MDSADVKVLFQAAQRAAVELHAEWHERREGGLSKGDLGVGPDIDWRKIESKMDAIRAQGYRLVVALPHVFQKPHLGIYWNGAKVPAGAAGRLHLHGPAISGQTTGSSWQSSGMKDYALVFRLHEKEKCITAVFSDSTSDDSGGAECILDSEALHRSLLALSNRGQERKDRLTVVWPCRDHGESGNAPKSPIAPMAVTSPSCDRSCCAHLHGAFGSDAPILLLEGMLRVASGRIRNPTYPLVRRIFEQVDRGLSEIQAGRPAKIEGLSQRYTTEGSKLLRGKALHGFVREAPADVVLDRMAMFSLLARKTQSVSGVWSAFRDVMIDWEAEYPQQEALHLYDACRKEVLGHSGRSTDTQPLDFDNPGAGKPVVEISREDFQRERHKITTMLFDQVSAAIDVESLHVAAAWRQAYRDASAEIKGPADPVEPTLIPARHIVQLRSPEVFFDPAFSLIGGTVVSSALRGIHEDAVRTKGGRDSVLGAARTYLDVGTGSSILLALPAIGAAEAHGEVPSDLKEKTLASLRAVQSALEVGDRAGKAEPVYGSPAHPMILRALRMSGGVKFVQDAIDRGDFLVREPEKSPKLKKKRATMDFS